MKALYYLLLSMRPRQWTKNLVIFSGLIFSLNLFDTYLLYKSILGFILFCLASGAIYIINDISDLSCDRTHPVKSGRPIASGRLNPRHALVAACIQLVAVMAFSYLLDIGFFIIIIIYTALNIFYSIILKNIVILDIFTVVTGFFLRILSGTVLIQVEISRWLFLCSVLLAFFLTLCKRRQSVIEARDSNLVPRKVFSLYPVAFIEQMISVVTAATIMSYALYTMAAETLAKFGTNRLIYTLPFVVYGIFRYLFLVYKKGMGQHPEVVLLTDKYLLVDIILWVSCIVIILYCR